MTASDIIAIAARAVALAAIVVMTGAVVFYWLVARRADGSATFPAKVGMRAAACVLLVSPARLYMQARALVDAGDPVAPMMANVLHTPWGRALMLQAAAVLLALVAFLLVQRRGRVGWWLALVPVFALCCTPALMGHAAAAEQYANVSIAVDSLHVVAAGGWIGALFLLALTIRSLEPSVTSGAQAATLIELFHPVALWCTGALLVTGVMNLSFRVLHFRELLTSQYGAIIAIKVALTLGVAGIGFHHSRRGALLARAHGTAAVRKTLIAESVTAVLVLIATAVLVGTSPPGAM
ncbi:MAG: copper resistance protein [Gemmatimonadetes bacterium]|nr:copper resistance protein [Gemmatimonadota bacterium]